MCRRVFLEPAAEEVCQAAAIPPRVYQMSPDEARESLERLQDSCVYMFPARINKIVFHSASWGTFPVYIVRPERLKEKANIILYVHGAGWVMGSFHTHEKLVRELAARTGCIVVFPEYARAPEARYPIAIEQCYSTLIQLDQILVNIGISASGRKIIAAGDSVGGNMTIAVCLMAKYRNGPDIIRQLLYYPVTNACFNTRTYNEFANGYYLYRQSMIWFWNQYTQSQSDRNEVTASPLRASLEQLTGLPKTMIINGQADVLRDEGEAFANKLSLAGVSVTAIRIKAIIHDFVMLNSLNETNACRAAMDVSTEWIKETGSL